MHTPPSPTSPTGEQRGLSAAHPARAPCEPSVPSSAGWAAAARVLPALLFALALATRLWGIGSPAGIVFDELHFGKFVQWTLKRYFVRGRFLSAKKTPAPGPASA